MNHFNELFGQLGIGSLENLLNRVVDYQSAKRQLLGVGEAIYKLATLNRWPLKELMQV